MISIPGKIPIRISPLFWVLILILGWLNSGTVLGMAIWAVIITFSVLVHEFGHALTALKFGQEAEIELVGFGGLTRRTGGHLKKWQEFLVIFNGPLAGFLLFLAFSLVLPFINGKRFPLLYESLQITVYVNLFWTFLNLLPVLPLDGGHLMRVVLEGLFGVTGVKISLFISMALAVLIGLFFFVTYQAILIGGLFLMLAFESYRTLAEFKGMTPQDSNVELQELMKEAQEDIKNGHSYEALPKLIHLREQTKRGMLFVTATQYAAHILAQQGQLKQAYEWLLPIENQLLPEYRYLLQQLAYRLQEWEEVVRIGNKLYQQKPSNEVALLNALASAIMGQTHAAVGWLRSLAQAHFPNLKEVVNKREFDAIRSSPEFQSFIQLLR